MRSARHRRHGVDQSWHRQAPAGPWGGGKGFQPRQVRRAAIAGRRPFGPGRPGRRGSLSAVAGENFDVVIDMVCFRKEQAAAAVAAFGGKCQHYIFCSTVCTYGPGRPPRY
jgi:hypothetical protein